MFKNCIVLIVRVLLVKCNSCNNGNIASRQNVITEGQFGRSASQDHQSRQALLNKLPPYVIQFPVNRMSVVSVAIRLQLQFEHGLFVIGFITYIY